MLRIVTFRYSRHAEELLGRTRTREPEDLENVKRENAGYVRRVISRGLIAHSPGPAGKDT